jgi:hypothetical protein
LFGAGQRHVEALAVRDLNFLFSSRFSVGLR